MREVDRYAREHQVRHGELLIWLGTVLMIVSLCGFLLLIL